MLTDAYLADVTSAGLFAWSFMGTKNLDSSSTAYQLAKDAAGRWAALRATSLRNAGGLEW